MLRKIKTQESLKEKAFKAIKYAIMDYTLTPGDIYTEQGLAGRLGISKSPVREACIDLASRGFLKILPRKGIQIEILDADKVCSLFDFRVILEKAVIRLMAHKTTDEVINETENIFAKLKAASDADDLKGFLELDKQFHQYLVILTGNHYMIEASANVRDLIDWAGAKIVSMKWRQLEAMNEHAEIVKKLQQRDPVGAAKKMEEHLLISKEKILSSITRPEHKEGGGKSNRK